MSSNNIKCLGKNPAQKDVVNKPSLNFKFNKDEKVDGDGTEVSNNSTLNYLNDKIKYLEIENNELKKEIVLNTNETGKLEYYIRIRKDLLEEIERIKNEKDYSEQLLINKNKKLEEENEKLVSKIKLNNNNIPQNLISSNSINFTNNVKSNNQENNKIYSENDVLSKNNISNHAKDSELTFINALNSTLFNSKTSNLTKNPKQLYSAVTINDLRASNFLNCSNNNINKNLKYFSQLNLENDNELARNISDYNCYNLESNTIQFTQKQVQDKETIGFNTNSYNTLNNNNIQEEIGNNINSPNIINLSPNPFVAIINELEERTNFLENANKNKDSEIQELKSKYDAERNTIEKDKEILQKKYDDLNEKYINAITSKNTFSEELKELADDNYINLRKEKDNLIHDLEKKIIILEKLNEKHLKDLDQIVTMSSQVDVAKQNEVELLKNNLKLIILEYEAIYKSYEENLKTLLKQIDSLKQLYMSRENEFLNITAYYTKTINDYATPIYELNAQSKDKKWQDMYYEQIKEIDDLRKSLENNTRENIQLRGEVIESKPKIRQRINEALMNYEGKLNEIIANHEALLLKLDKLFSFMEFFEGKFNFFNSLIEDNKRLMEQLTLAECNFKSLSGDTTRVEVIKLKEANLKLTNEIEMKNNLLKDYENLFEQIKTPNNNNLTKERLSTYQNNLNTHTTNKGNFEIKKKTNFVNEEIVVKLNSEISLLSTQINNLNKTRGNVETFYQAELKKLTENLQEKNDKIEELKGLVRKIENDFIAKKETVYNLWVLEFKEFKENLISLTDIKNLIEKFKSEGEELNAHKRQIVNEEIFLIRQEISKKDESLSMQKKNFETELKETKELLENYKKNFTIKLESLDKLIKLREIEFNSLMSEKEKLIKIEENKKKVYNI